MDLRSTGHRVSMLDITSRSAFPRSVVQRNEQLVDRLDLLDPAGIRVGNDGEGPAGSSAFLTSAAVNSALRSLLRLASSAARSTLR